LGTHMVDRPMSRENEGFLGEAEWSSFSNSEEDFDLLGNKGQVLIGWCSREGFESNLSLFLEHLDETSCLADCSEAKNAEGLKIWLPTEFFR